MIKKIVKAGTNSTLLGVLFLMFLLPISFMGFANYEEKSSVLSAQDSREKNQNTQDTQNKENFLQDENVPEEIKEVIMRLEREYYKTISPQDDSSLDTADIDVNINTVEEDEGNLETKTETLPIQE